MKYIQKTNSFKENSTRITVIKTKVFGYVQPLNGKNS